MSLVALDRHSPPGDGGNDWITRVAEALTGRGWCLLPDQVPPALCAALRQDLQRLRELDGLRPAGVGPGAERRRLGRIRGDRIHWLDGDSVAQAAYLTLLEQLRQGLNQRLFMGLDDIEAHYAHYPPGSHYARHLDAFRGNNLRRVSSVCYLNPDWQPGDGGELCLHAADPSGEARLIPPLQGSLVVFLSEAVPHEVLRTRCDRLSVAAWFRIRPLAGEALGA